MAKNSIRNIYGSFTVKQNWNRLAIDSINSVYENVDWRKKNVYWKFTGKFSEKKYDDQKKNR